MKTSLFTLNQIFKTNFSILRRRLMLLLLVYSISSPAATAQIKQWEKTFFGGGNTGDWVEHAQLNKMLATPDGGYLLGGSSAFNPRDGKDGHDFWLIKIDSTGKKQWEKRYGGLAPDNLNTMVPAPGGGYLLGGTSKSGISGDKTEASRDNNTQFYELGDYWIIKIDADGNKIWDKTYGGTAADDLRSIIVTPDGGFLLAGSSASGQNGDKTQVSKGLQDYWLVKIDGNGVKFWDKTYGGSGQDELYSIGRTTTGEFFVAGHSSSGTSGDKTQASQGGQDYWMLKLSPSGEKLWDKSFGGSQDETLRAIVQTPDGGYLLAGSSASGISGDKTQASQGGTDYWLIKTDRNGNKAYDQRFGGAGEEELRYIERTADGGYILGGRSDSGAGGDRTQPSQGGQDYWLVKVRPSNEAVSVAAGVVPAPVPAAATETKTKENSLGAYPNPFIAGVAASFTLPQTQLVTVKVYDGQGREVATLYQG